MSASEATATKVPLKDRKAAEIEAILAKYPRKQSGVLPLLYLVQEDEGWVSSESVHEVAEICEVHPTQVQEVVSFYPMYNRKPVGKYTLRVCGTLPCALCGSDGLMDYLKEKLGVGVGEVTEDGQFTIKRMECLGACSEAPLMIVDKQIQTHLTRAKVDDLLERCAKGEDFSGDVCNSDPNRSDRPESASD